MQLPLDAQEIIPHRDSMLLIDTLVKYSEGKGTATTKLSEDTMTVDEDGVITPLTMVELIAQGYAAFKGLELSLAGKDFSIGYLVGVQKFSSLAPAYAGDDLTIEVETYGEFDSFAIVEGRVLKEDLIIATGKIKLWMPPSED